MLQKVLHSRNQLELLPHNYFDGLIKLFSDLYLAKFFSTLVKSFFLRAIF